jgi:RimJ/RimL family protein N-acetyltransferase
MPHGLLLGEDSVIASWTFSTFNIFNAPINKALGIVDSKGQVVGSVLFQNFNGVNVELSYYGPRTLTYGIVKAIARVTVGCFNAARLTVVTSKRNKRLMRGLLKIGFKLEGVQRCYYGHEDNNRNTGVRFVMFRDRLSALALAGHKQEVNVV